MSYTIKNINNDGLIIEMFRYDILPIMEFLYKYENVNGFGINIYYNKITDVETIDIEVFTRHTDIINELLSLNCFTEEDILQVFEEDIRWFQLPWMNRFFGSFNEEYQLYRRKRNIEKL